MSKLKKNVPIAKAKAVKKSGKVIATKTKSSKADIPQPSEHHDWRILHIFNYGDMQLIGPHKNIKMQHRGVKQLKPLFTYLSKEIAWFNENAYSAINVNQDFTLELYSKDINTAPERMTLARSQKNIIEKIVEHIQTSKS